MGVTGSKGRKVSPLNVEDVYDLGRKYNLTIAEVAYCHSLFTSMTQATSPAASPTEASHGTLLAFQSLSPLSQELELDWLLARVFSFLFQPDAAGTEKVDLHHLDFDSYVRALSQWREKGYLQRLDFLFQVLDIDQDGTLSASDICFVLQQMGRHEVSVGDPVHIKRENRTGVVRFIGETQFAEGMWAGIELHQPAGRHNGTVGEISYFKCPDRHGYFVLLQNVESHEHHRQALEVIKLFDIVESTSEQTSISKKDFMDQLKTDSWLTEILMRDPLPNILSITK
ncbi:hypothetical protein BJ742DRAFT_894068 [Cladochytrium replicatum]|nr:hypothetical protein BJ742DRAFT_894068 [Cladochytrium replicatum]